MINETDEKKFCSITSPMIFQPRKMTKMTENLNTIARKTFLQNHRKVQTVSACLNFTLKVYI